jgi:hypothetical protein
MRKSYLKDGRPFFGIKVEHFVKKTDFAKHLAEYYYLENIQFDEKITRQAAFEILKTGLFHSGLNGLIDEYEYEGSNDALDSYYIAFKEAIKWIEKNYPYLQ